MITIRRIRKILRSKPTLEGAEVHLKRVFGFQHVPQFDPFLLLDDFHSNKPDEYIRGFPWHPHRGIETITYVLQGEVEHGDSLENKGVIGPGDVQWMTAGSGIIHQEMPKGQSDGVLWGFQLWANLPASHKMMEPRYRDVQQHQIPEVTVDNGCTVRIICGEIGGVRGPAQDIVIDPGYFDVTVPAGKTFTHRVEKTYTVLAYIIEGNGYFEPERDPNTHEVGGKNNVDSERDGLTGPESLVAFENGEEVVISSGDKDLRFLLISGKPLGEPVAWQGPIVMNTQEELRIAFAEYKNGTFLKHDKNS